MGEDIDSILETKQQPKTTSTVSKDEGFFSFGTMISTTIIKILYVIGMIFIVIGGIIWFSQYSRFSGRESGLLFLIAIILIILGNVIWRIVCEIAILLFRIYEILCSIEKELKQKSIGIKKE